MGKIRAYMTLMELRYEVEVRGPDGAWLDCRAAFAVIVVPRCQWQTSSLLAPLPLTPSSVRNNLPANSYASLIAVRKMCYYRCHHLRAPVKNRLIARNIMHGIMNARNVNHNIPSIHNTNPALPLVFGQVNSNWATFAGRFFLVGHGAFEGVAHSHLHDATRFRSQ
jgi:hypothetical protein